MRLYARRFWRLAALSAISAVFATTCFSQAQTHIVSPSELQKDAAAATQTREQNEQIINHFLSSGEAKAAMKTAHVAPAEVKTAVSQLDDQELAQLAARSQTVESDFAAGRITDRDLIIILLGIVALILIIVAVR